MMFDLICLGNLTVDDVILPQGQVRSGCFGGDAIYAVLGGQLWSDRVRFVAPTGSDFPETMTEALRSSGLDCAGMPIRDLPVIRNKVHYKADGQRHWTLLSDPDNFFPLSPAPADIPKHFLNAKAFLILAMDMQAQSNLAAFLASNNALVALDPQEDYIPGNEQKLLDILQYVDIFMPSLAEVELLLKTNDVEHAAERLADYGPKIIVIKLGTNGSLIYSAADNRFIRIPMFTTTTVDTTGAGDSYCGGFMTAYAQEKNLIKAGLAGAVAASFAVEGFGLSHMFHIDPADARNRFKKLSTDFQQSFKEKQQDKNE